MSSGMKVSEFMIGLAKKMKEERKIAETTAIQYLQTLHKLNGDKPFNNLSWCKKHEEIQKIIDTYAPSTQGNQYMVLSSALSTFKEKPTYKACYNHWRDKMMEARKEREAEPSHQKNEKQEENWLTWEEVNKKKSQLKEEVLSFHSNKHITASQYELLLQYVVLSLYTDIAPRRNQDYLDMFVVKKLGKDYDKTKNYYDLATQRFVFNKYKTFKKHGEQIEELPTELQEAIKMYLVHHPLATTKSKEYKFLVKPDGSPLNTVNSITRILNRIFGKKVGSSMLRHIYLSSKYGDTIKELAEDTKAMSHTPSTAMKEYIKFD